MNNERIQQLLQFVQEQPNEPFNLYALAMEYLQENPSQSVHYLEMLLEQFPQYLPTYYQAASLYQEQTDRPKAEMLYQQGLELARDQKNDKIFGELQRAYRAFQDEDDEY